MRTSEEPHTLWTPALDFFLPANACMQCALALLQCLPSFFCPPVLSLSPADYVRSFFPCLTACNSVLSVCQATCSWLVGLGQRLVFPANDSAHSGEESTGSAMAFLPPLQPHPQPLPRRQMELQQLGLAALRLPGSLEELGASPLFAAAANDLPDAAELAALLQKARQESATALDWGQVLQTLRGGQLQASQASQLVGVLARAADSARQQLEAVTASSGRPSGGSAAPAAVGAGGDPRLATALRNSLKLSLFFLCCLARGEGSAAGPQAAQAAGGGGGQRRGAAKKAKAGGGVDTASAATAALAQLRARRDALLAINAIEEAVHACRALLPAVPDLRAAAQAARRAALHCLVHPSPVVVADRGAKDLAVACSQAATGWLPSV